MLKNFWLIIYISSQKGFVIGRDEFPLDLFDSKANFVAPSVEMNLIENCYSDEVESKKNVELFTKETTLKESDDLEYVKTVNEFPDCKENELLEAFN